MSSSGEVETQAPVVEQPQIEAPVEQQPEEKMPVVEMKDAAPKVKKPKGPAHPPYFQMIKEAITALNEKGGSSPYAIAKYIEQKHKTVLPANFRKILGLQLKNSVAKGKLIKVKASYKLSESGKREKGRTRSTRTKAARANATKPNEIKRKKPKSKKVSKIDNPTTTNTSADSSTMARKTKKSAAGKPRLLKKIKSPAVRKANKASAA